MIDDVQKTARRIAFDTLDIKPENSFLRGGEVWQRCRTGETDPMGFGDSETDLGMPPIRYALLHDFATLNKCELLGCDDWGELTTKAESDLTDEDIALIDRIAELTVGVDERFDELRRCFHETDYGRTVSERIESLART